MPTFIAGYEIDAVLSEGLAVDADITDHPVESGGDITDHIHVKPRVVNLDCIVSDTPLPELALRRGADVIPSDTARQFLENLQLQRTPVLLSKTWKRADGSEGYRAYDNMAIQSLGETIDDKSGDAYHFKATFKQMKTVTNNRTTVRVAVPRVKKPVDKGAKATTEGKPPEAPKVYSSVLNGAFTGNTNITTGFQAFWKSATGG